MIARGNRTQGIDVSVWQDDNSTPQMMDFSKSVQQGVKFVFIKASQATHLDSDFTMNWNNAKSAGILRGAYHYLDWTKPAVDQANFFAGVLASDPGELPPVLDYECRTGAPSAGSARLAARAFLVELKIRMTNVTPILYTSPGFWQEYGSADVYWSQFPLWLAHYTTGTPCIPKPWKDYLFWQYTSKGDGHLYGAESKSLDMDWFNGSEDELYRFVGGNPFPPTPTLPSRVYIRSNITNIRNAPIIDPGSDVGDLAAGKMLDVIGDSGDFWQVRAYVAKSVVIPV